MSEPRITAPLPTPSQDVPPRGMHAPENLPTAAGQRAGGGKVESGRAACGGGGKIGSGRAACAGGGKIGSGRAACAGGERSEVAGQRVRAAGRL
eukprot:354364-Chlamydomonas_euryale.AAC.3